MVCCTTSLRFSILSTNYIMNFHLNSPFISKVLPTYHTTAVFKIKPASFQNINITEILIQLMAVWVLVRQLNQRRRARGLLNTVGLTETPSAKKTAQAPTKRQFLSWPSCVINSSCESLLTS